MKEAFKIIPGFKDYAISKNIKILSLRFNKMRLLSITKNGHGYNYVCLYNNKIRYSIKVSELMLITFIGPCPEGMEISHLNGNKSNDELKNLKWEYHYQNMYRKIEHGTSVNVFPDRRGEKNPNYKGGISRR